MKKAVLLNWERLTFIEDFIGVQVGHLKCLNGFYAKSLIRRSIACYFKNHFINMFLPKVNYTNNNEIFNKVEQ